MDLTPEKFLFSGACPHAPYKCNPKLSVDGIFFVPFVPLLPVASTFRKCADLIIFGVKNLSPSDPSAFRGQIVRRLATHVSRTSTG